MPFSRNIFQDSIDAGQGQSLLVATLNASVDGIIVICENGMVRLFNRGAEELFGYSADEIIGCDVGMLMPTPQRDSHTVNIRRFLETGKSNVIGVGRQVLALAKNGETFPIHLSLNHFETSEGPMFVGFTRDLRVETNLQIKLDEERQKSLRLQRDLSRACNSSTLLELVSSIAHEMNQPLAAIANYAAVGRRSIESETPDSKLLGETMSKISSQAIRASDVINRMRDLAKKAELPRQRICMDQLITELMSVVKTESEESDYGVRWYIDENLPEVLVCPAQIQHVLLLLLRNSLEAMSGARREPEDLQIWIKSIQPGVELSIKDRGHGVSADIVDRMYYPFTTDKIGSLGIGLSICNTIICNHGGDIWYKPNSSGGSRFYFTLPAHSHNDSNLGRQ